MHIYIYMYVYMSVYMYVCIGYMKFRKQAPHAAP